MTENVSDLPRRKGNKEDAIAPCEHDANAMPCPASGISDCMRLNSRMKWVLVCAGILLYVLVPSLVPRTALLMAGVVALAMMPASYRTRSFSLIALAVLFYMAYIFEPFPFLLAKKHGQGPGSGIFYAYASGICLVGIVWLYLIGRNLRPLEIPTKQIAASEDRGLLVHLMLGLFCLATLLHGVFAAIPYAGDEGYHIVGVEMFRHDLMAMMTSPMGYGILVMLVCSLIGIAVLQPQKHRRSFGFIRWGTIIILAILCVLVMGEVVLVENPNSHLRSIRVARYPIAQNWLSALFVFALREGHSGAELNWIDPAYHRLLPLLFLFGFAIYLITQWKEKNVLVRSLIVASVISIPYFGYYSTVLYLDLLMICLTSVVMIEMEHVVRAPARELLSKASGWCLLLLPFSKDTALPILLIILGIRFLVRLNTARKEAGGIRSFIREECGLLITVFLPLGVYLVGRYALGTRSYGMMFSSLFSFKNWYLTILSTVQQLGLIAGIAIAGGVVLLQQKRYLLVVSGCLFMLGIKVFYLLDSDQYVTLVRFNFAVAPGVIMFAWYFFKWLEQRKKVVLVSLASLLFISNFWIRPQSPTGEHLNWDGSSDLWYPYEEALLVIKEICPEGPILMANHSLEYIVEPVLVRAGWDKPPKVAQVDCKDISGVEEVKESLRHANSHGFPVMLFRCDKGPILDEGKSTNHLLGIPVGKGNGYVVIRNFEHDGKFLSLFVKVDHLQKAAKMDEGH